jgi:hypothetical protein
MKMKYTQLVSLLSLCAAGSSFAAIVDVGSLSTFDGGNADFVVTLDGVNISSGFAGTGFFSVTDSAVSTYISNQDWTNLKSAFTATIGTDDFNSGVDFLYGNGNIAGGFAINNSVFDPTSYLGNSIYTFISGAASVAATNEGEFALFKHNETLSADPSLPATPTQYALNLKNGTLLVGVIGTSTVDLTGFGGSASTPVASINIVPETSSALLGAMGALLLLRRRRN